MSIITQRCLHGAWRCLGSVSQVTVTVILPVERYLFDPGSPRVLSNDRAQAGCEPSSMLRKRFLHLRVAGHKACVHRVEEVPGAIGLGTHTFNMKRTR